MHPFTCMVGRKLVHWLLLHTAVAWWPVAAVTVLHRSARHKGDRVCAHAAAAFQLNHRTAAAHAHWLLSKARLAISSARQHQPQALLPHGCTGIHRQPRKWTESCDPSKKGDWTFLEFAPAVVRAVTCCCLAHLCPNKSPVQSTAQSDKVFDKVYDNSSHACSATCLCKVE
jgi:hypothetical protein